MAAAARNFVFVVVAVVDNVLQPNENKNRAQVEKVRAAAARFDG